MEELWEETGASFYGCLGFISTIFICGTPLMVKSTKGEVAPEIFPEFGVRGSENYTARCTGVGIGHNAPGSVRTDKGDTTDYRLLYQRESIQARAKHNRLGIL